MESTATLTGRRTEAVLERYPPWQQAACDIVNKTGRCRARTPKWRLSDDASVDAPGFSPRQLSTRKPKSLGLFRLAQQEATGGMRKSAAAISFDKKGVVSIDHRGFMLSPERSKATQTSTDLSFSPEMGLHAKLRPSAFS